MLVGGASVGKTAKALFMSESTVKTHVGKVYDKLDAHNRAEAVMAAVRLGLVKTSHGARLPLSLRCDHRDPGSRAAGRRARPHASQPRERAHQPDRAGADDDDHQRREDAEQQREEDLDRHLLRLLARRAGAVRGASGWTAPAAPRRSAGRGGRPAPARVTNVLTSGTLVRWDSAGERLRREACRSASPAARGRTRRRPGRWSTGTPAAARRRNPGRPRRRPSACRGRRPARGAAPPGASARGCRPAGRAGRSPRPRRRRPTSRPTGVSPPPRSRPSRPEDAAAPRP